MDFSAVLGLLKQDLGISNKLRDAYLSSLIEGTYTELGKRAVHLDLTNVDDTLFLSDYCAWVYRKRISGEPMPEHLKLRMRNYQVRNRGVSNADKQ